MAIANVGTSTALAGTVVGTTGISLSYTPAAIGNLLIVAGFESNVTTALVISDTNGNTWFTLNPDFTDGSLTRLQSFYCFANAATSTSIKMRSGTSSSTFIGLTVDEFSGVNATPIDQVNHSAVGATGADPTTPSITLGAADCLVWAMMVDQVAGILNIDGALATLGGNDSNGDMSGWRILSGRNGISVNAQFDNGAVSSTYEAFIASIKPAGAAAARVPYQPQYHRAPVMAQ